MHSRTGIALNQVLQNTSAWSAWSVPRLTSQSIYLQVVPVEGQSYMIFEDTVCHGSLSIAFWMCELCSHTLNLVA